MIKQRNMIKENILVSHNQIIVRSIPFNHEKQKWTEETLERGILWNKNYVILDPLVDESFGSWFFIEEKDILQPCEDSIRAAIIPFEVTKVCDFSINTVSESIRLYKDTTKDIIQENEKGNYYPLNTLNEYNFEKGNYSMLFEICMGKPLESSEEDEVYYKFTFKKEDNSIFKVLKDDPYGWNKQMSL